MTQTRVQQERGLRLRHQGGWAWAPLPRLRPENTATQQTSSARRPVIPREMGPCPRIHLVVCREGCPGAGLRPGHNKRGGGEGIPMWRNMTRD